MQSKIQYHFLMKRFLSKLLKLLICHIAEIHDTGNPYLFLTIDMISSAITGLWAPKFYLWDAISTSTYEARHTPT